MATRSAKLTVHVTSGGGQYVEAKELLANPKVQEKIRKMEGLFKNKPSNDAPSEGGESSG